MRKKNPAAVALGRLGGLVKVPKGWGMLTPEQRSANGRKASAARWAGRRKTKKPKTSPE